MSGLVVSATTESAWAAALYAAWVRYESTPLFNEVVAEMGNPLSLERRLAS